jgi:hypothetical protein
MEGVARIEGLLGVLKLLWLFGAKPSDAKLGLLSSSDYPRLRRCNDLKSASKPPLRATHEIPGCCSSNYGA